MIDENRIFAKNGLKVIAKGQRPGIKALKDVSGIPDGEVDSTMVAFRLAPENECFRAFIRRGRCGQASYFNDL